VAKVQTAEVLGNGVVVAHDQRDEASGIEVLGGHPGDVVGGDALEAGTNCAK
jgi:hypothetical protein